jgi:hypothetical protein
MRDNGRRADVNLKLDVQVLWDPAEQPAGDRLDVPVTFDLAEEKHVEALVLSFGNALFQEVRAIGHSKAAVYFFVRLLQRGGYQQATESSVRGAQLYQKEDGCFAAPNPFIFIAPTTLDGDRVDFTNLEADIRRFVSENVQTT